MPRKKTAVVEQPTSDVGFKPGDKILRKMYRDGEMHYVSGYEVFDPELTHSCTGKNGGRVPLSPKSTPDKGEILIIAEGQDGKPLRVKISEICAINNIDKNLHKTFAEVFGSLANGVVVLQGYHVRSEQEDLTLGVGHHHHDEE